MKILVFAEVYYPDVMGGGEYSTKQMAEGLAKRGHEVVVHCLGVDDCTEELNGIRVNRHYVRGLSEHYMSLTKNNRVADPLTQLDKIIRKWPDFYRSGAWYRRYSTIIQKEDPDAVNTASPMSYLGRVNLWRAAFDMRKPMSHVSRAPNLLELKFLGGRLDGYNRRRNAKASAYLTALAAPSRYMLDCHNRAGIRGGRFNDVIYNAVDFPSMPPSLDLVGQKERMVLYAGALKAEKGIHTLLRAVDGLEGVRLRLIGRGALADAIEKDGKTEVIDWMARESLYAHMRRARVVVLPAEWDEAFGRILIEAIHNGTIAIGSDRGGIPEVLDHNDDYIFHAGDVGGLRRRIERMIRMPASEYMEEIGKQQKKAFGFTNEVYIDHWERFFLQQLT